MKVLLIDDDINLSKVLAYQLQKSGYQVSAAKNGREGLSLFYDMGWQKVATLWLDSAFPISRVHLNTIYPLGFINSYKRL